jgi:hypothetical protein
MLSNFNFIEVYQWCLWEMMCDWKAWFDWFEEFDCLLLLGFKLYKCWFEDWSVKLFMDLYWKNVLKAQLNEMKGITLRHGA